jgi:UPF0716 protein FxsA
MVTWLYVPITTNSAVAFYNLIVFFKLLVIFIIVPLLELLVIIEVSSRLGLPETILVLVLISVIGAALAKREGYAAARRIQAEIQEGRVPGDPLIEGGLILAGAVLLLTPGFLTDAVGLMMLIPPTRKVALTIAKRRLRRASARRTVFVWSGGPDATRYEEPEQRRKELE